MSRIFACGLLVLVVITLNFSMVSCEAPQAQDQTSSMIGDTLKLNLIAIPVLGASYRYQIWLVTSDAQLLSVDTFAVLGDPNDPNITFRSYSKGFRVGADILKKAKVCFLSIEAGKATVPSNTRMLAGTFSSDVVDLVMEHDSAFGANFLTQLRATSIKFRLDQFTGSSVNDTSASGVWFIDTTNQASPVWKSGISLLPALPRNGWKYEGWLVKNGHIAVIHAGRFSFPLSTGKFTNVGVADENQNYFGGTNKSNAPAFPGEDFFTNTPSEYASHFGNTFPQAITKSDIVTVSIEPNVSGNDDSPIPFSFKPFACLMAGLSLDAARFDDVLTRGKYYTMLYVTGFDAQVPIYKGTVSRAK